MPTTAQMLSEYDAEMLEVIAEQRSASVEGGTRTQMVEALAAELTNPTSVRFAYEDAVDMDPRVKEAVDALIAAEGEIAESKFSKRFGTVRQMGPAKMRREMPWLSPESVAEVLYYLGLLGKTFRGAGQGAHTVVYLPSDIQPWIGDRTPTVVEGDFPLKPRAAPPPSRTINADDSFLADVGTLLGFLNSDTLRLEASGPNAKDVDRLVQRLQLPFDDSMPEQSVRLALLLHLANRLGWLRRGDGGAVTLTGNRVREFLEKTRAEQRQALFQAWHSSQEWNDLCRTPGLECDLATSPGRNDPLQTRANVLALLGNMPPVGWYSIHEFVRWARDVDPNFQRPNGRHDEWNIRSSATGQTLAGLENWDLVEGALLRFLIRGPLHWLGAVNLAEPAAGDDWVMSLTSWGALWLDMDVVQPHEPAHRPLQVREDFAVLLPLDAPLYDRFRVERFAQWQSSYPQYVYQITQRSLKRAADVGIAPPQILDFLTSRTQRIPERVTAALQKFQASAAADRAQSTPGRQPA